MRAGSKRLCPHCGVMIGIGWGWQKHMELHPEVGNDNDPLAESEADASDAESGSGDLSSSNEGDASELGAVSCNDDSDITNDEDGDEIRHADVVHYLDALSEDGTLCPVHVMQYMLWGKRRITTEGKLKTLLFLRAMYGGTGASRRQGQEMLSFVHGLGVAPLGMPRQIKDCWLLVTKVLCACW